MVVNARLNRAHLRALLYPAMCSLLIVVQGCTSTESISYRVGDETGNALLCRPQGNSPFPAVIYNHGISIDEHGYAGASKRGIDLAGICKALAKDGFLAFVPIRASGLRYIPRHAREVSRAIDYVRTLPDVDPSRIALMGLSRGGLLTLMVGVQRQDLMALVILAPAPGNSHFERAVERVPDLNAPVLLLIEADDEEIIMQDFTLLKESLKRHNKEARTIIYDRGGGHRLFYGVDYYWDDVRAFLHDTSAATTTGVQLPGSIYTTAPTELVGPRGLTAGQVIANVDQNDDARISRDEFRGPPPAFDRIDTDGDGLLTREELETFWRARGFGNSGG
jgi:dienelactone hydrolase